MTFKQLFALLKKKVVQPHFWVGLGASLLLASGLQIEDLGDWAAVGEAIKNALLSPYILILICIDMAATLKNDK